LHPGFYAKMLGEKIRRHRVHVWLINTGWSGGAYGEGDRIPLSYTRAIVSAILDGGLENCNWKAHPVFHFAMPENCSGVPDKLLDPEFSWKDPTEYRRKAKELAARFIENFEKYKDEVPADILDGAPAL
jgi:phosphoenolpyruvate carboxykinase (ATP)